MPTLLEEPGAAENPFADLVGGDNGGPAYQTVAGRFSEVPKADAVTPLDLGAFADMVPGLGRDVEMPAVEQDLGIFQAYVPESPTKESEKALAEVSKPPDPKWLAFEKGIENVSGQPFHKIADAMRRLGRGAGHYIFDGMMAFERNRAALEHPMPGAGDTGEFGTHPAHANDPEQGRIVLPDGSFMSEQEQQAFEEKYQANLERDANDALSNIPELKRRSEEAERNTPIDPALDRTVLGRLSDAAGPVAVMTGESLIPVAGMPLMVMHGALATEQEALDAGATPEQAQRAAVRSAIGLGIFGGVSKLAAAAVAKALPRLAGNPKQLVRFITQFTGQEAANETSSRVISAWNAAADAPEGQKVQAAVGAATETTLENTVMNSMYALAHAAKASRPKFTPEAPASPASEPEPSPVTTPGVAPETARYVEPVREATAVRERQPQSAAERQAEFERMSSNLDELNRDQFLPSSEGDPVQERTSSQPEPTASAPNAASRISQEPIGVEAAIAEIQRRNAPGEIMSPGPGAASAREPLASYEERRFGKRFQETEGIAPEIREQAGNRYYEPIPNKLTLEEASKIVDERGTDEAVRLVRDETFAMEPRVRATLGQTLVQKLNQSHAEATAAGDHARAKGFLDQAVDTAEYLGEFGTRLGQGVQSFAIWSRLTPEGMLESAKRSAKRANVELSPEQQAEIRKLAAEAHAAPEGIPKHDAAKKLADYMVTQTGIPAKDLPLSIYYTHILSGVNTHIVNAVDTALNVWHEANTLAMSNPKAAASVYRGLMRGLGEGKYDALLALKEGRRISSGKFIESPDLLEVSKFGKKGGVPIADTGKVARVTKRIAESKIAKPLNAYKYVMRMMSASDSVFFRGAEEARASLLAHRLAESSGVEKAKLQGEIDSILGYDRLPKYRARAAKEGYTGAKAEARATELMIQSRPESLRSDAADYAGVSTYNHEPRGVLGYLSNHIAQISNKYPAVKLFVPFSRIVANVTNRGLDNTPVGILRALKGKGMNAEERQRALTRGIAGTAGIMGLGLLNATGAIQIHGAGPSDREKKKQLQNAGWKPFSIQVGDHYFTYTYTPVGLGLSVLGNYLDADRYKELSQKDSLTRATYAFSRIGQTVFSQSFLSGLSNLFTILSGDPGQSVSSLKQFFSTVATGATTPNLIRDINHVFDPSARKSENIAQDLIRNIPVARLALKPTLNAFGDPVELSRNRFFSSKKDDPAWRLVAAKNLRVPVVDQTTFEDNDDGYLYAKIAGERMKKYIVRQLPALERAKPAQAQEMLSQAARRIFDGARQEIVSRGGVKKKSKRALALAR